MASESVSAAQAADKTVLKTNRGTVERMDQLRRKRPDLAAKVRRGEMTSTAALRQLKRDEWFEQVIYEVKTEVLRSANLCIR